MKLQDTVAIVSGGASGLGEATVRHLHRAGAAVGIFDRPGSKGAELAAELGERVRFVPGDVTDAAGVESAVQTLLDTFGKLTLAVSCAGVGSAGRVLNRKGEAHDLEVFEMTVRVNLVGTFNVLRLASKAMLSNTPNEQGERGVIVNTASIAAMDGQIGQVAYAASKGGVVGMTLPVARDLAQHGIRCVTIAPGTFATPMLAGVSDEFRQQLEAQIPFPSRLGDPADYAALVAHIVENAYLNGETIRIDGALRMPPR